MAERAAGKDAVRPEMVLALAPRIGKGAPSEGGTPEKLLTFAAPALSQQPAARERQGLAFFSVKGRFQAAMRRLERTAIEALRKLCGRAPLPISQRLFSALLGLEERKSAPPRSLSASMSFLLLIAKS